MIPLKFTEADANRAYEEWGANCGPGALAAIVGQHINSVRTHIALFDQRHYTNPSMMFHALRSLSVSFKPRWDKCWPDWGLVRIQWEGPWTEPGVPIRARYRYTHWIGACAKDREDIGIFDINCMNSGGWVSLDDWQLIVVPFLLKHNVPNANGKWSITHSLEVTL